MKSKNQLLLGGFLLLMVLCQSCKKDTTPTTPPISYATGVFTINQGQFGSGTGTISYYNRTTKTVITDVFQNVNKRPLGNVAQSMQVFNGKGYIIVDNDSKTEVVTESNFVSTGTISGLTYPRYFLGINASTGYISQWGAGGLAGSIAVVNLNTNKVTSTITTGNGAENMILVNNTAYVACSGGFGNDSVVTVINTITNTVSATIQVGPNPQSLQLDANGKIWVLCEGIYNSAGTALSEPGKLVCINPSTNAITLTLPFISTTSLPGNLIINTAKNMLYYIYQGGVYSQDITLTSLNTNALINESFYGLGIDPVSNYLFGANAGNNSSNGWVLRFTTTGSKVDSFQVGIIPGNFCFQ
jgi:YVTN family beta-propeller protein